MKDTRQMGSSPDLAKQHELANYVSPCRHTVILQNTGFILSNHDTNIRLYQSACHVGSSTLPPTVGCTQLALRPHLKCCAGQGYSGKAQTAQKATKSGFSLQWSI